MKLFLLGIDCEGPMEKWELLENRDPALLACNCCPALHGELSLTQKPCTSATGSKLPVYPEPRTTSVTVSHLPNASFSGHVNPGHNISNIFPICRQLQT